MGIRVSDRIAAIAPSATLAVDAKAKALKAAGEPVIGFGAGEPDFATPDHIVAAALGVGDEGNCTGFLTGPPMVGESRSAWLTHYAALHGIDLAQSFAYADSHVDLPMLRAVGNPVAISPDIGLMRAARASGWSIIDWPVTSPQPRWKLPSR